MSGTSKTRRSPGRTSRLTSLPEFLRADAARQVSQIQAGFPVDWFDQFLAESGLAASQVLAVLMLPQRTLVRRRSAGLLALQESDRLARLARLFEQAVVLFEGDREAAARWFSQPVRALGFVSPLEMARTEAGSHEVGLVIGRLEHGVYT